MAAAIVSRLRVAVLVDLVWRPGAGGHLKTWERLARAIADRAEMVELSLHVLGGAAAVHRMADHVRVVVHRPAFSTDRLPFLRHLPDHTDLAPYHPGLARALPGCDVLHTTDTFAFARTAACLSRRSGTPLVHSIHTDTAAYAGIYAAETVTRLLGEGRLGRLLDAAVAGRAQRTMRRRLLEHLRRCTYVLANRAEDRASAEGVLGGDRVRTLRRGVDRALFRPGHRDRRWLAGTLGIPTDRVVVLYVGRLDRTKSVEVLAEALRELALRRRPVHLVCAGEGPLRATVERALGPRATCLGSVPPDQLARIYASADLFAFPSRTEVLSNAVQEALCSGLAVLVSATNPPVPAAAALLVEGTTTAWIEAIDKVAGDPERRAQLAQAALAWSDREIPTWAQVLDEDLLPAWRAAGA